MREEYNTEESPPSYYQMSARSWTSFPGVWKKEEFSFQRQDVNHSGESKWKYFI